MRIRFFFLISLVFPFHLLAQEAELNNDFRFKDGIYLSIDDFKNNAPSHSLDSVEFNKYRNSMFGREARNSVLIRGIKILNSNGRVTRIKPKKMWGFTKNGIVYVRTKRHVEKNNIYNRSSYSGNPNPGEPNTDIKPSPYFVYNKPSYLGSICLVEKWIDQYRSGLSNVLMIKLKTGEKGNATALNLGRFITDDVELYKEFQSQTPSKKDVYHYITRYNERNKVMIPLTK